MDVIEICKNGSIINEGERYVFRYKGKEVSQDRHIINEYFIRHGLLHGDIKEGTIRHIWKYVFLDAVKDEKNIIDLVNDLYTNQ